MIWKNKKQKSKVHQMANRVIALVALPFVSIILAPQLLAWPHKLVVGDTTIYAEHPIAPEIKSVLTQSDALLRRSAIYSDSYGKRIFLTEGGWRWRLLALNNAGGLAISRPLGSIIITHNSVSENWVKSDGQIGKTRSLSSIIAHERTHDLIRAHFGLLSDMRYPKWKREGYCDYIAQESSLNAVQVAAFKKQGRGHPAIVYFEGRQKVTRALDVERKSVDQLFIE